MAKTPVALSLLCCEQVIVEEGTRNISLINSFNWRASDSIPTKPLSFIVFSLLTDGQGEMPLEIIIQRLDDWEEVYRRRYTIHLADSLQEARCQLLIRECVFPMFGSYQISLFVNEELLGQRHLRVVQKEK